MLSKSHTLPARALVTLTIAVCFLAATALPASAFFQGKTTTFEAVARSATKITFKAGPKAELACEAALYTTGPAKASEQIKLTGEYEGCKAKLGGNEVEAAVYMNNCGYNFHQASGKESGGALSVECPKEESIQVKMSTCEIKIGEKSNNNLKEVNYKNAEANEPEEFGIEPKITNVSQAVNSGCKADGIEEGAHFEMASGIYAVAQGGAPLLTVSPIAVNFGKVLSGETKIRYTFNGRGQWAPDNTLNEFSMGNLHPAMGTRSLVSTNGCRTFGIFGGLNTISAGGKCEITLKYAVSMKESYLSEFKLPPGEPVMIKAEL